MANNLDQDITGKTVIVFKRKFRVDEGSAAGFGAVPYTMGTAVFGTFLDTGKKARVSGYDVESLVEEA